MSYILFIEIWLLVITIALIWVPILIAIFLPLMGLYANYKKHSSHINMILAIPFLLLKRITRNGISRWVIWRIGLIPSHTIRKLCYILLGVDMGENVIFHFRTELRDPQYLKVGAGTIIGDNALLDARQGLTIGENVNLSSNVSIYTLQHNHRDPNFECTFDRPLNVEIGDRAWLGCNVIVLPGVKIGKGAVVCAGAVVTKDVGEYEVVAGIPAKKVGDRPKNINYTFKGKSCWFY